MSGATLPNRVDDHGQDKPVDAPFDAGNATDVAAARRAKKASDNKDHAVLRQVLGTKDGRALAYRIIYAHCGVDAPALHAEFNQGFSLFREGQRSVGIVLRDMMLLAARENFLLMLSENLKEPG